MRFLQAIVFLVFLGAVLLFALQNTQTATVQFLSWGVNAPIALLTITSYVLGMLSGWTVVSFLTRNLARIAERQRARRK